MQFDADEDKRKILEQMNRFLKNIRNYLPGPDGTSIESVAASKGMIMFSVSYTMISAKFSNPVR